MLILDYLKTHSLDDLEKDHAVSGNLSSSKKKISLNYDQIDTKESDLLAQECRGLILRHSNNNPIQKDVVFGEASVVAFPFKRFFNFGQGSAAEINFSDPDVVFEDKVDGTCIILYFDKEVKEWHVATRSVPEADFPFTVGLRTYTFRQLVEMACQEMFACDLNKVASDNLNEDVTYILELTSPYNRIVVDYSTISLTLLGARNNITFQEYDCREISTPFPLVKQYPFNSFDVMMDHIIAIDPKENEGIVVKDKNFNRVKVKSPAYVSYNKILFEAVQGNSGRRLLELILSEKHDDVFPMLPKHIQVDANELLENYRKFHSGLVHECMNLARSFDATVPENRKALALKVQELKLPMSIVMHFYNGNDYNDFIKGPKNCKNGIWNDGFLDSLLNLIQKK